MGTDGFAVDEILPVARGEGLGPVADHQFAAGERDGVGVYQVQHVVLARSDGHDDFAVERNGVNEAALMIDVASHEVHAAGGSHEEAFPVGAVRAGEEPDDLAEGAEAFGDERAAVAVRPGDKPLGFCRTGPEHLEPGLGRSRGTGELCVEERT